MAIGDEARASARLHEHDTAKAAAARMRERERCVIIAVLFSILCVHTYAKPNNKTLTDEPRANLGIMCERKDSNNSQRRNASVCVSR